MKGKPAKRPRFHVIISPLVTHTVFSGLVNHGEHFRALNCSFVSSVYLHISKSANTLVVRTSIHPQVPEGRAGNISGFKMKGCLSYTFSYSILLKIEYDPGNMSQ